MSFEQKSHMSSSSAVYFQKVKLVKKIIIGYYRNAKSKLYDAVSAPVATRDALLNRLKSICNTVAFYRNKGKWQLAS